MNRYRITETDKVFAAEFKRNLEAENWFHSPGLQRVLNAMRGESSHLNLKFAT